MRRKHAWCLHMLPKSKCKCIARCASGVSTLHLWRHHEQMYELLLSRPVVVMAEKDKEEMDGELRQVCACTTKCST